MDNDTIVKRICQLENIDLGNYHPTTEWGEKSDREFDKRFSLDRTYMYDFLKFTKRVRFVKYPNDDFVTLQKLNLKSSNIIVNPMDNKGKFWIYDKQCVKKISLRELDRPFKLNNIKKKMGR
jgi:hypothetical protein